MKVILQLDDLKWNACFTKRRIGAEKQNGNWTFYLQDMLVN